MTSIQEKKVSIIPFSGAKSEWSGWQERFKALAYTKGYGYLLDRELEPTVVPKEKDSLDDKKTKVKKDNVQAIHDLMISIETLAVAGDMAQQVILNSKTPDYPEGNIVQTWKDLSNYYSPRTVNTQLSRQSE